MTVISKLEALRTLGDFRGISAGDFADELRRRGLPIGGPWHAHTILVRLKRQGLAQSEARSVRGIAGDSMRRRRAVLWSITERGTARAQWLADAKRPRKASKPAANPGGRRGKRG